MIVYKNVKITCIKDICNIANNFFIEKISNLRDKFTTLHVDPIKILGFLIPKTKSNFKLKPITLAETNKLISKAKSSNSLGSDIISMKVIKKFIIVFHHILTNLLIT